MTTNRMPTLTAEQLRTIANEAVADVARQKITTSKSAENAQRTSPVESKDKGAALGTVARKTLHNPNASEIQKSFAGTVLSQAEAKGYFKEAFNKVRKG
ncbi:hypothetical protein ABW286_16220 [Erwinia papayae]|uniref:Uncharacterized protein n=1 Tax=Erwinia papayae TaxID=206499 RepID=A0ABV3N4Q0_9GAMM